jgi:hypothetical protein
LSKLGCLFTFCYSAGANEIKTKFQTVMTQMAKKCSTGQNCIRKEVTSYKIGTLADKPKISLKLNIGKNVKKIESPW